MNNRLTIQIEDSVESVVREQFQKAAAYDQVIDLLQQAAQERGVAFDFDLKRSHFVMQSTKGLNTQTCFTLHEAVTTLLSLIGKERV